VEAYYTNEIETYLGDRQAMVEAAPHLCGYTKSELKTNINVEFKNAVLRGDSLEWYRGISLASIR
jgi:hypothetical protein